VASAISIEVRSAKTAEAKAIIGVWDECGLTRPWNDPESDLSFSFSSENSDVLVAFHNEKLIGTLMVGHDGHRGWVYYLAVLPEFRRADIGRRLMSAAEAWLKARNVPKLNIMFREGNEMAAGFYEALGFETSGVHVVEKFLNEKTKNPKPS
jgi:ribosomal protein S18 acetylase RimI-like enzyme